MHRVWLADRSLLYSFTLKGFIKIVYFYDCPYRMLSIIVSVMMGDLIMFFLVRAKPLNMPCRMQGDGGIGFDTADWFLLSGKLNHFDIETTSP